MQISTQPAPAQPSRPCSIPLDKIICPPPLRLADVSGTIWVLTEFGGCVLADALRDGLVTLAEF